jgi:heptosyltransferase-1
LVDRTDIQEMMAIIAGARLAVGNDSGPLHIAAALAVPVVGLYGPTDPVVVGPYGQMDGVVVAGSSDRRRHRYSRRSEHRIDNITVKQVLETVEKKMKLSEIRQAKESRTTSSRGL